MNACCCASCSDEGSEERRVSDDLVRVGGSKRGQRRGVRDVESQNCPLRQQCTQLEMKAVGLVAVGISVLLCRYRNTPR